MAVYPHRGGGRAGWAAALVFACALALLSSAPAGAAGVGPIYSYTMYVWAESGPRNICLESYLSRSSNVTVNTAYVAAYNGTATTHCTNVDQVAIGNLAAVAKGYRNGTYCGTTGNVYNNVAATLWFATGNLCTVLVGTYDYQTTSEALVRHVLGSYVYHGPLSVNLSITR